MSQHSTIITDNWSKTSLHNYSMTKASIMTSVESSLKSSLILIRLLFIFWLVKLLLQLVKLWLLLIMIQLQILLLLLVKLWLSILWLWWVILWLWKWYLCWSFLLSLHKIRIHGPFLEQVIHFAFLFFMADQSTKIIEQFY